jgi:all-trans-retinol 13,14-reductase
MIKKKMYSDVVIIGSGVGGLTCGTILAKYGLKTTIIEQHFKPGGYVTSYKRDGFLFDLIHIIGGLKKGSPLERIFSFIGLDEKIDFIEVEKIFKFIYPNLTINCYSDINKYKKELIKYFPKEKKRIDKYFQKAKTIWEEILRLYNSQNLDILEKYPADLFPNLNKYQFMTHLEFLNLFFKNRRIKEILGGGWLYAGLNNSRVSALYYICILMSYHSGGAWYPKGGYQCLSDSLAKCFKECGGILKLKTKALKILIKNDTAIGVELDNGMKIKAKYIISNADTKKTFHELLDKKNINKNFIIPINKAKQSTSGFVVHLGVSMNIPKELNCGCIIYIPTYNGVEKQFKLYENNKIQKNIRNICFGLSISTLKDPHLAPAGKHVINITYLPAPAQYKKYWRKNNKKSYEKLKESTASDLIKAAENLIPHLSKHILTKDVNTPITYERYTSASEGAWYDIACTPEYSLLKRKKIKIPIKNLYLTGSKTDPGHGVFGAIYGGLFTAKNILKNKLFNYYRNS